MSMMQHTYTATRSADAPPGRPRPFAVTVNVQRASGTARTYMWEILAESDTDAQDGALAATREHEPDAIPTTVFAMALSPEFIADAYRAQLN
jgi:hypothetical protein